MCSVLCSPHLPLDHPPPDNSPRPPLRRTAQNFDLFFSPSKAPPKFNEKTPRERQKSENGVGNGVAKNGLAKNGQRRMAKNGLAKRSQPSLSLHDTPTLLRIHGSHKKPLLPLYNSTDLFNLFTPPFYLILTSSLPPLFLFFGSSHLYRFTSSPLHFVAFLFLLPSSTNCNISHFS